MSDDATRRDGGGGGEISRRELLELLLAGAALAATGCAPPSRDMVPYVRAPRDLTPGLPLHYATALARDGFAVGLLVTCREGRPVKVEGSPEHPASLGASGVREQAALLDLYDPTRARATRRGDAPVSWADLRAAFGAPRRDGGERLALLLAPTASPLRAALLAAVQARHPRARLFVHDASGRGGAALDAARAVLGAALLPLPDLTRTARVLAVECDFAADGPWSLRAARELAQARRAGRESGAEAHRLWVAESSPSSTGSLADERIARRPGVLVALLAAVARALGVALPAAGATALPPLDPHAARWAATVAGDLAAHRGASVVLVGDALPPLAHALAMAIHERLGATGGRGAVRAGVPAGAPLAYVPALRLGDAAPLPGLAELTGLLRGRALDTLLALDGDPAATAPSDLGFGDALAAATAAGVQTLALATHDHATARRCRWVVPAAHPFESWGDERACDGTITFRQPLLQPLLGGRSVEEVLAAVAGRDQLAPRELLRAFWSGGGAPRALDDPAWEATLQRGLLAGSAAAPAVPRVDEGAIARLLASPASAVTLALPAASAGAASASEHAPTRDRAVDVELCLRLDPYLGDGDGASNPWLLELPDPVTRLSWSNAALLAPATAERLDIVHAQVVGVEAGGRRLEIPACVVPGHAEDAVTVRLGWGRDSAASGGAGVDAFALRTHAAPWGAVARVRPRTLVNGDPRLASLAFVQATWTDEGRGPALERTLAEWPRERARLAEERGQEPTLFAIERGHGREQWGMAIDLDACTGCSACVVACQAENNVPVVGQAEVRRGRLMHWLRVDRYATGDLGARAADEARLVHQPMACQHCEAAPCEYVCPVNATVHSDDGLNEMVYNRCVGTRFCSNNCPYKVRRFNWLDYNEPVEELAALHWNPEVTVRERGVMEKCTYCVQRIRRAQQIAAQEHRALGRDAVVTACAQACPTQAIVFGDLADAGSRVAAAHADPRGYEVLHELGTRPRTRYLLRLRNAEPALAERSPTAVATEADT